MPGWTTSNRVIKQDTGSNLNLWGAVQNAQAFDMFDQALDGYLAVPVAGSTLTLTSLNGVSDQSRPRFLKLTASGVTTNFTVFTPNVSKLYRVWNATSYVATFSTGSGTTVTVDAGDIIDLQCDGTNWTTPGVNGLSWKAYIASVVAGGAGGNVPSPIGNAGKWLTNNGTISYWSIINATDLADYQTNVKGLAVAMASSL